MPVKFLRSPRRAFAYSPLTSRRSATCSGVSEHFQKLAWLEQRARYTGETQFRNLVYLPGILVAELSLPTWLTTETLAYVHTDPLGSPIAKRSK